MDSTQVEELARELYDAGRVAAALAPISERHPEATPADAYVIQEKWAALRTQDGATEVGRKIGCTSKAIQDLFGIDTPDYGRIFDDMMIEDGGAISRSSLILPMVECELAFGLGHDLAGPGVTRADALSAIERVFPCLEIIDSRIDAWRIRFVDTVADNGSSGCCVLGQPTEPDGVDLAAVAGTLRKNGTVLDTATGAAVLGHPAEAVAWLANAIGEFGGTLRAGQYVLSGSFMTADRAEAGDRYEAEFAGIGAVSCHFV